MSEFFKNKRGALLGLGAFFLAMTLLAGSVAYLIEGIDILIGPGSREESSQSEPAGLLEGLGEEDDAAEEDEGDEGDEGDEFPDEPETDPEPELELTPVHYNRPGEMRGVFLTPGEDFITSKDTSTETIKSEIDKAIADAKALTMNTVIIDTVYAEYVIYQTVDSPELSPDFDIMDYLLSKCREANLYTYAIFDASFYNRSAAASLLAANAGAINTLSANLREFSEKYPVDGVLLDGYVNTQTPQSYSNYAVVGAAIGYDNFMLQSAEATVRTASRTLRKYARGMQVGLLADAVWANDTENEEGSATKATFTSLGSGYADTKSFLTEGLVDFVAVKAYYSTTDPTVPFGEVVKWWTVVAQEAGVPMYAVHASSKICTEETGWQAQDQLVRQLIEANEIGGFGGSIFNSLKRLSADPKSSTTTMMKYYNQEVETEHILQELAVTKPEKSSYTTTEPVATFTGASDPNFPVTINGEAITTDASGYFTVTMELKGGENAFTISHKDKSVNYVITREIEILKEIAPHGSIAAEGGMSINITALAYEGAKVYAVINGTTVAMSVMEEAAADESSRDSSYVKFSGSYTAPAATGSEQNLGNIVVHASWRDQEKSIQGAAVKVNKKAKIEDGVPVVVVADQAMTYPYNTLDNIPNAAYYPLPQGAMDYAVGDEIVYKKGSDTYTYFVLASKMRVEASDISTSTDYASGNAISGMTVRSEGGYTYLTLKTAQKVSYSFAYTGDGVSITFNNTASVPESAKVDSNAIFKGASWSGGNTLSLSLVKSGGFMGYKGYYDGSELVFRFNNPPSSVSGARIAIDPGHGGKDSGALGFLADYPEKRINLAIAQLLANELTSRGANVLLLDTSGGMELKERVRQAEKWNADLLISVHNNTAPNASAAGTEVYYFYPFAKALAANASSNVSSQLSTNNRGARQSYYHVTLSSQVPSVLVECGFMSNKTEYEKLIKSKYQALIATGIANAVTATIQAASTGYVDSGGSASPLPETSAGIEDEDIPPEDEASADGDAPPEQDGTVNTEEEDAPPENDGTVSAGDDDVPPEQETGGSSAVEGVFLSEDSITMEVGAYANLICEVEPFDAENKSVTWRSGNTSVVTVSSSGKVTAVSEGVAKVSVKTADGGYEATCQVTVIAGNTAARASGGTEPEGDEEEDVDEPNTGADNNKVQSLELDETELTIYVDTYERLIAIPAPSSVTNLAITWSSSDSSVAVVDAGGTITGLSVGTCYITATVNGTNISARCKLNVIEWE